MSDLIDSKSVSAINRVFQQIGFLSVQMSDKGKLYSSSTYRTAEFSFVRSCLFHGLDPQCLPSSTNRQPPLGRAHCPLDNWNCALIPCTDNPIDRTVNPIPCTELSKLIAQKGHKISFISTPNNINRLPKIPLNLKPNIDFIKIPLPKVENLQKNAKSTSDLNRLRLLKRTRYSVPQILFP
ncbi:hypothetical protein LguiA_013730 [Lonicera macranthoides]